MKSYLLLPAAFFTAITAVAKSESNLAERVSLLESRLASYEQKTSADLNARWNNGLVFENKDQSIQLKIGGRTQIDVAFFDADQSLEEDAGAFTDGVRSRRVRLYLSGTVYENLFFKTEYDFSSDMLASVYMGVKDVPVVGHIRVGHQTEPTGLEENTSNNYITFLERGSVSSFNPVFNTGVLFYNTAADKRMTWAIGAFKDTDSKGNSVSNEAWAITARVTGLPYITDDGEKYLHIGASTSHRNQDDNFYRIRARPLSRIAPNVVDSGNILADSVDLFGFESVLTLNRLSLQAEWMQSSVDRTDSTDGVTPDSDVDFQTFYAMASFFLTGEHRPYAKDAGALGLVKPKQNATGKDWGSGAWELAARYDVIDLNDSDISGGEMKSCTLGLNWYMNHNSLVMFNYIMSDVEDSGNVDTFTIRFQVNL